MRGRLFCPKHARCKLLVALFMKRPSLASDQKWGIVLVGGFEVRFTHDCAPLSSVGRLTTPSVCYAVSVVLMQREWRNSPSSSCLLGSYTREIDRDSSAM